MGRSELRNSERNPWNVVGRGSSPGGAKEMSDRQSKTYCHRTRRCAGNVSSSQHSEFVSTWYSAAMLIRIITTLVTTSILSACAVRAPGTVEVDGYRIEIGATSIAEYLHFERSMRTIHGTVSVRITMPDDSEVEHFGTPTPTLVSVIGPKRREIIEQPGDGTRLDVKISGAMEPAGAGRQPGTTFGFGLERPVNSLAIVRGILETARIIEITIFDVQLSEMMDDFHEVAERCRVWAKVHPGAGNRVRIETTLEVEVNEESREMPNAPRRIEIIADDWSVIGEPRTVSGSSSEGRVKRRLSLDVDLPDGRKVAAIRLHLVTRAEWREYEFEFRNVPMRGRFARGTRQFANGRPSASARAAQ